MIFKLKNIREESMVNKINLSTPEGKREYFVKQGIMNGAAPAAAGLGIGAGITFLMNKNAMKDEFKTAKQAIKDAKKQNAGKEAIKEAKKGVKDLYSKVANKTFGANKKQTAIVVGSMIAGLAFLRGIVEPAVRQYTHGIHGNGKSKK